MNVYIIVKSLNSTKSEKVLDLPQRAFVGDRILCVAKRFLQRNQNGVLNENEVRRHEWQLNTNNAPKKLKNQ